jgi:dephospho-CoA kinase
MIVAFTGPKGSGKTTAAKMLGNYEIISFAAPLKKCLRDLFNFSDTQLTTYEGKEAIDPRYGVSPRIIMQKFGTEFVRKTVPGLWESLLRAKIESDTSKNWAVDDCRFEAEAQLIRDMGGIVVHLLGRQAGEVYKKRWWEKLFSHKSERGVKVKARDIVIDNTCSMGELQEQLHKHNLMREPNGRL